MSAQKQYKAPLELDPSKFIDCTLEDFESNVGVVFVKKEKKFKVDTSVEAEQEADDEEPLFGRWKAASVGGRTAGSSGSSAASSCALPPVGKAPPARPFPDGPE